MDIAEREGISLGNCVYVGDGENDMYAVEAAGLGIAFSPRNGLKMVCDVEIDAPFPYPANMKDVLRYVL
jgi:phosphoserine phosphatase